MLSRLSAALLGAAFFFAPRFLSPRVGEVRWKLGRVDEAQDCFKQGLAISPQTDVLKAALARLVVTLPTADAK